MSCYLVPATSFTPQGGSPSNLPHYRVDEFSSGDHEPANAAWDTLLCPPARWTDDLRKVVGSGWMRKAAARVLWRSLGEVYVQQWIISPQEDPWKFFENVPEASAPRLQVARAARVSGPPASPRKVFDERNSDHWRMQAQWVLKLKVPFFYEGEIFRKIPADLGGGRRDMWDFYPLKPPRWPPSVQVGAPRSPGERTGVTSHCAAALLRETQGLPTPSQPARLYMATCTAALPGAN
ncbi:unnamed protein product [Plutella xylostella]|uniref:(diamondback moth) hypothetical protein n=1 Tax=Plutella xylostella TaxID=51655 RepID=A0A8S4DPR4_PLUXY|nr:unnamed protein product [Plutella xylostella]